MKFCAACTENLENTQELPKQKLITGKILFSKNGSGSGHVSNASQNHEFTVASPALPGQFTNEHNTAPEDAMQIDLVPELPPSGG